MKPNRFRLGVGLLWFVTATSFSLVQAAEADKHQILMVAGKPSHGYGSHEHYAGLKILEEAILEASDAVEVTVVRGWPEDAALIEKADSIVIYSDGGGGHVALPHRDAIRKKLAEGCGFVCLHYAVEVPKGEPGNDWLDFLGGYFETHWSVNPHWVAEFTKLPEHPVTRGVKPFSANDEWYFHMRFKATDGVKPILSAIAPESTMRRPDGPHSGNPDVRKSVAAGEPQTVAWVYERPDGGRSFGFTGGHFHWNWGQESILRLVANAIRWTAKDEIDQEGSKLKPVGVEKLMENQDYERPGNFSPERIAEEFHLSSTPAKATPQAESRMLAQTPVVTTKTSGHQVKMEVNIEGVRDLFLVVTDGGDSYSCDWADWIDPILEGPKGKKSLVELPWVSATSDWGSVRKNANCDGQPWSVRNEKVGEACIGVHANSVVHYQIPEGYKKLTVTGALDSGGANQQDGQATSVRFAVYSGAPPKNISTMDAPSGEDQRDPKQAIAGLVIADGLEATLAASEPQLKSLTNLDIDDRGRIWVCDVMNYRGRNGARPEGDRILILEDTTGDGIADSVKTFYQGRDIDSAMGICVLGNQVIVSASPYIIRFTDADGDDVPEKKEMMFTGTGQPQHDHSAHSFLFGPDGKLYWNVGNTGQQVKDAKGETVVDIHGRAVVDNGKPLFGGMPFRCNLDGSEFEVLAHNFRNNWETTVDSFGTLWQSDNDDDGNRGVRINFVMEQGNYGYRDELTGGSWQQDRITMEKEIPDRHWHLNDPGVVPNLLQTGAGSPTGICVYEGRLLPKMFWDQVIHCDAGPNVVRAYPVQSDGAGYTATMEPLMTGVTDKWFRPADVCVAPDGSLFVTDWYDPGVGGHRQEDSDRGRLFRLAPPGTKYVVPKFDYSTVEGAAEALRNPNMAVRYKAWMALHGFGVQAEPALLAMYKDENPRIRARAAWLLGKIPGREKHHIESILKDSDADLRIVGIRLAKQLKMPIVEVAGALASDDSAAVRRELAVALRYDRSPEMPQIWATLAREHDGKDRWYLEALGIGSDLRADECLQAWLASVQGDWNHPSGHDIVWRTRGAQAALMMVKLLQDPKLPLEDSDRYFRSLEYHDGKVRTEALAALLSADMTQATPEHKDSLIVRAIERMVDFDYSNNQVAQEALARHVDRQRGTSEFLRLIKRFQPKGMDSALEEMAFTSKNDSEAVEAVRLLSASTDGPARMRQMLRNPKEEVAVRAADLVGLLANNRTVKLLGEVVTDPAQPYAVRSAAVKGLARNAAGANAILEFATESKLPADTKLLAAGLLSRFNDKQIVERAATLLPLPQQANKNPLPPLDVLVSLKGDVTRGQTVFRGVATCANCHLVDGHGKQVGPDLSEIGSKLSREAMFTSILDPSAGISHNYENYIALLDSGQVISGVKVSETESEVILRTADAIDRTLAKDEIEEIKKSEKSIMPDNLHHTTDQQGLVDIVEYMMTLQKKG